MDESVQDAALRDRGLRYIGDHPSRAVVVSGVRVLRLFELYRPHPFNYGPRVIQRFQLWTWYLLIPLAIAGAVVAHRRSVSLLPFGATLVAVVVNAAVSWGTPRFRVPLEISMIVLAAFAVDAAIRRVAARRAGGADAPTPEHADQPPVTSEGAIPR